PLTVQFKRRLVLFGRFLNSPRGIFEEPAMCGLFFGVLCRILPSQLKSFTLSNLLLLNTPYVACPKTIPSMQD
ncbi:hypothetical protein, partial [Pseudomonas viridiflava]|uniref:hypothetical protein n=1 Tax=Pseudomonas viridiflava TaxID=33069 RepID=UPI00197C26CF